MKYLVITIISFFLIFLFSALKLASIEDNKMLDEYNKNNKKRDIN